MSITLKGINKWFGQKQVIRNVSLSVPEGKLVALLGPSGSGKTTLLRLIGGLEHPDQGEILFKGENITHQDIFHRQVGFVFQHYALFKHMTIFNNIAFGMKVKPKKERPSKQQIRERVQELLRLVQLEEYADRYPQQLSGGQRQRVALARALAIEPKYLLLDEPFGALDAKVRQELRRWLRRIHDQLKITSIIVTHDQEEALELADHIVVMNEGEIAQEGHPSDVYHTPSSSFVYQFLGRVNTLHARYLPLEIQRDMLLQEGSVNLTGKEYREPAGREKGLDSPVKQNYPSLAYARPHDIEVKLQNSTTADFQVTVTHIYQIGCLVRVETLREETGEMIEIELYDDQFKELAIKEGDRVYLNIKKMKIFSA